MAFCDALENELQVLGRKGRQHCQTQAGGTAWTFALESATRAIDYHERWSRSTTVHR